MTKKTILAEGSQKRGIYPFLSENIIPGIKVIVKSAKHRRELMKQHGLKDARDFSGVDRSKKRRWHGEGKSEEKKALLRDTFLKARHGKIDLRPVDLERRKRSYLVRNGYTK